MATLAYYIHQLSPFIVRFTDSFGLRWYGFAYLLGFICAFLLLRRLAKQGQLRIPPERVGDFVLNACIFGVLIGGRLGYVLLYDLPYQLTHGGTPLLWEFGDGIPYWGVLKVWEGGMAAHGGVIGVVIALWVFAKLNKYSFINLGDAACMVIPLGLLFGRIANFINGELYGHPTTVSWGVKFPTELIAPTKGDFAVPAPARKEVLDAVQGQLGNAYQLNSMRDVIDLIQGTLHIRVLSPEQYEAARQFALKQVDAVLPARHPSQLYEAALEGVLLFLICWFIGRLWKKDGMAAGAFLTFYPIMRIIGEQYRVGDPPPAFLAWTHLSAGVVYSVFMLVAGVIFWGYWIRKPSPSPTVSESAH